MSGNALADLVSPYQLVDGFEECGTSISANGGIEGLDRVISLGELGGSVSIEFDAYSIPDSLKVSSVGSGRRLFSTGGMVSGVHKHSFYFDPVAEGSSKVRARVEGSGSDTAWALSISCPSG